MNPWLLLFLLAFSAAGCAATADDPQPKVVDAEPDVFAELERLTKAIADGRRRIEENNNWLASVQGLATSDGAMLHAPALPYLLDRAYFTAWKQQPRYAFKALLESALTPPSSNALRTRQLQLVIWTLRRDLCPADDAHGRAIIARVQADKDLLARQWGAYVGTLRQAVLADVRAGRVDERVALDFATLLSERQQQPLLALLALRRNDAAVAYWRQHSPWTEAAPDFAWAESLTLDEWRACWCLWKDEEKIGAARLRQEHTRCLDRLRQACPATRSWSEARLLLQAGLQGSQRALIDDLVQLTHPRTRVRLEQRLKQAFEK